MCARLRPSPIDSDLPPTARRILAAAMDILAERGYQELTVSAIVARAGCNRALVSYYFGSKAGLIATLVDTLFRGPDVGVVEHVAAEPPGPGRIRAFLDWQRSVSANRKINRMLFELVPQALRDPAVRERLAQEYRHYRGIDATCLAGTTRDLDDADLEALAAVSIAVVDGLGLQQALDPEGFDHEAAWRIWQRVVSEFLRLPPDGAGTPGDDGRGGDLRGDP